MTGSDVTASGASGASGASSPAVGRRRRLAIVGGIAAALVVVGLTVAAVGARRATDAVDRIRTAVSTAVLTPADLATFAVGDPGSDPVAGALGLSDELVSATSASGAT